MSDLIGLATVLRGGRQCDEDGTEIIMSREACCVAADEIEKLTAAKTQIEDLQLRIRKLETDLRHSEMAATAEAQWADEFKALLTTERAVLERERLVSDKLEKALAEAVDEIEGMSGQDMSCDPNIYCDDFRALLEEVAAIRAKQE